MLDSSPRTDATGRHETAGTAAGRHETARSATGRHEAAGTAAGRHEAGRRRGALSDDTFTVDPRIRGLRTYLREAVDRLAGADPGLTQLRNALLASMSILAGAGGDYLFVRLTGALQLPTAAGAEAVAANHVFLIVAMLLGGIVAMMAGFAVQDPTPLGQAATTLLLPLPMIAATGIGLELGRWRIVSLVWLVVLMFTAVYVRRFGQRGFAFGLVAFQGGFLGFFLHTDIKIGDVGWLAAELGVGALASLIIRFALFRPDRVKTLHRMRRSWQVRLEQLVDRSLAVLDAPDEASRRAAQKRVDRQVVRLNESSLIVEAQLATAIPRQASTAARQLFDVELLINNIARFTGAIASQQPDELLRTRVRVCLSALQREDWDRACLGAQALLGADERTVRLRVLAHRLGHSVSGYVHARRTLHSVVTEEDDVAVFTPAVQLRNGFTPGSAPVSDQASSTPGRGGRFNRAVLPPYLRAAIQVAVASSIAIAAGDAVSGFRLYWAVLATFLAFMATTNSGEQVRKAFFRVLGTAIGIVLGDVLVHLTGARVGASLALVLVAMFLGIYLMRVNYTFMVIAITVTISQLYAQLGEFSWSLLVLRLAETAVGVGAVLVTVLFIVPLRPQRVLTAGVLLWLRALSDVLEGCFAKLRGENEDEPILPAVRQLDAAFDALESAAAPLRRTTFGRNSQQLREVRWLATSIRSYVRTIAVATQTVRLPDSTALQAAFHGLRDNLVAIEHRLETGETGRYVRVSSLVTMTGTTIDQNDHRAVFTLTDLTLLDGALARLATSLGIPVVDYDTTAATPADPGAARSRTGSILAEAASV